MKNFIYGDFESKYDRTVFKKIPGKSPEIIFFTQSGKELERLNIEKFDRSVPTYHSNNISRRFIYNIIAIYYCQREPNLYSMF